jgi:hypothetical protein
MRRSTSRLTAVTLLALAAVAATAPIADAKPAKDPVQTTKFTVTLTSRQTVLDQLGAGGAITYGWNQLTGTAPSSSGDIDVELLGNVQYTDGEGPFFGFTTLTFASLAHVGFRMHGNATKDSSGVTHLTAKLKVIGGSGALIGVRGGGSFTGTRAAQPGSPVELSFTIKLRGVSVG